MSANLIPEPTTRSLTVFDARISLDGALPAIRAATCTARPLRSFPRRSHSPVCNPARIVSPRPPRACRIARVHWIARVGPVKANTKPSPVVLISCPSKFLSSRRTTVSCSYKTSFHFRSPISETFSVDPTMSVTRTVKRTRSVDVLSRVPVRNSCISSTTRS